MRFFRAAHRALSARAVFIGGRDIDLAMDMFEAAQKSMFTPFEVSVFADPSGAFTTAAAMVAKVEVHLKTAFSNRFAGQARCRFWRDWAGGWLRGGDCSQARCGCDAGGT